MEKRLKTGMYYREAVCQDAVKVTVSSEKSKESYVKEAQSNEPEDCLTAVSRIFINLVLRSQL